jgi:hypothetical protein
MGGPCSVYGEGRNVYRDFVGKPVGKRPLGRPRHRWEDNIKADLQEVGCGVMELYDRSTHSHFLYCFSCSETSF